MLSPVERARAGRWRIPGRIAWTIASLIVVQGAATGLAALPVVWSIHALLTTASFPTPARIAIASFAAVPAYVVFALLLLALSPAATRVAGWRTPADAEMRIADFDWPLLTWARYNASIHFAGSLCGWLFRATPLWSAHLRWYGARIGRRVFINSPHLADYNLLDFADDVVIGGEVHLSGHTVEGGFVKTGGVRLGRGVTVGLAAVIGIGVTADDGCQIGAMSLVPKRTHLGTPAVYVGIPVHRIA